MSYNYYKHTYYIIKKTTLNAKASLTQAKVSK